MAVSKKNVTGNLALSGFRDIFQSTVNPHAELVAGSAVNVDTGGEVVVEVCLNELHPPDFHPFHLIDDEAMDRLVKNIKQYGVREPGLARPRKDDLKRLQKPNKQHNFHSNLYY